MDFISIVIFLLGAAVLAARELMDRFKDRFVNIVDSLGIVIAE